MCGICEGVQNHNWQDVPIIAVETEACGAVLSLVYSDLTTITNLVPQGKGPVVVIVCGGSGINYQLMAEFEGKYL